MADDQPPDVTVAPPSSQAVQPPHVVVGFPDGKRMVIPPDLRIPERKLPAKLTKNELKVRRQQRRKAAYDLWLNDLPYTEIGRQLGVSGKTAFYYVQGYTRAIDAPREKSVQASRAKHVAQLAAGKRAMMAMVLDRQVYAKDRVAAFEAYVLATTEQAKLNGEHMPLKVASTNPDGTAWAPLAIEQLTAHFTLDELRVLEKAQKVRLGLASADDAVTALDAEVVGAVNE